jgi:hypothetical protein
MSGVRALMADEDYKQFRGVAEAAGQHAQNMAAKDYLDKHGGKAGAEMLAELSQTQMLMGSDMTVEQRQAAAQARRKIHEGDILGARALIGAATAGLSDTQARKVAGAGERARARYEQVEKSLDDTNTLMYVQGERDKISQRNLAQAHTMEQYMTLHSFDSVSQDSRDAIVKQIKAGDFEKAQSMIDAQSKTLSPEEQQVLRESTMGIVTPEATIAQIAEQTDMDPEEVARLSGLHTLSKFEAGARRGISGRVTALEHQRKAAEMYSGVALQASKLAPLLRIARNKSAKYRRNLGQNITRWATGRGTLLDVLGMREPDELSDAQRAEMSEADLAKHAKAVEEYEQAEETLGGIKASDVQKMDDKTLEKTFGDNAQDVKALKGMLNEGVTSKLLGLQDADKTDAIEPGADLHEEAMEAMSGGILTPLASVIGTAQSLFGGKDGADVQRKEDPEDAKDGKRDVKRPKGPGKLELSGTVMVTNKAGRPVGDLTFVGASGSWG